MEPVSDPTVYASHGAAREPAPDPRKDYGSPEDLREDVELDPAERESLLRQWKQDVEAEINAESEGMSASDPITAEREAKLSAEARRVNKALVSIERDNKLARGDAD